MAKINLRKKIGIRLNAAEMKKAKLESDYVELPAGESDVHESLADHWYVKAHLVKKEEPKKEEPKKEEPPLITVAEQAAVLEKAGRKRKKDESDEDFVARIKDESSK